MVRLAAFAGALGWSAACTESPLGRNQLVLYPPSEMAEMGSAAFDAMKREQPVARSPQAQRYVSCVVDALLARADGRNEVAEDWEVAIFQDDEANAFALPGGKIGVNTGMLALAQDQNQLATVLAHEIGHVLAQHTNERLSTTSLTQTGLGVVQTLLGAESPARQQLLGVLGLGTQVGVLLPFDRAQESEADLLGLKLMARAGFDPSASIELWRSMARAQGGAAPPEFLSTHPADATRIAQLQNALPDALALYRSADQHPDCTP